MVSHWWNWTLRPRERMSMTGPIAWKHFWTTNTVLPHLTTPPLTCEVNCSYPEDSSCHKPSPRWHLSMMLSHLIDINVAAGHHALSHNTHHKDPKASGGLPKLHADARGGVLFVRNNVWEGLWIKMYWNKNQDPDIFTQTLQYIHGLCHSLHL